MPAGEGSTKLPFLIPSTDSPWCRCSDKAPPAVQPADLPMLIFSHDGMEMFDPSRHLTSTPKSHGGPSTARTPLPLAVAARANPKILLIPREEDCFALWERYDMLDNIREHSKKVAGLALAMANAAKDKGLAVCPEAVYAAGLLHDLAKTYTIHHDGHHAQLGGAWVMRETGNGPIAQAVHYHVHWPWEEQIDDDRLLMVFFIVYADKRVMHDMYVSLDERFSDLVSRYAVNDYVASRIKLSLEQGKRLETALSRRLGVSLDECIADSGRLVQRT